MLELRGLSLCAESCLGTVPLLVCSARKWRKASPNNIKANNCYCPVLLAVAMTT